MASKVYVKPTDTQNLLHTESFHPPHTTRGILKSQLIRYKRISCTWDDYVQSARSLFHNLKSRGYSWSKMWTQLKLVWFGNSESKKKTENTKIFPIIVHYDNVGKQLAREYRQILQDSPLFENTKLIVAYKNHKKSKQNADSKQSQHCRNR